MPRIMTMNGDHQSVATAPLDLSTTKRGNAGSRSPDCRGCARDARVTAGSPAPPACTGTDSLDIQCAAVRSALGAEAGGAARKRPADKSFRLPFRKRKINLETEAQTQSPAPPELGERFSTARDADAPHRFPSRLESDAEDSRIPTQRTLDHVYPVHLVHPYAYGHYQVCCLQTHQPVVQLSENLQSSVSLATRQDEDGDTALHIAVVQGELSIVYKLIELLLWAGKGLDIYNNLRQTPLHLAVITQQVDMVGALLRAKADPTALDRNGQTALHLCCEYNQSDCMSVVLASLSSSSSSSTCLEIKNYEGLSPLHLAVLRGQKDLARMLLKAGADINAMDIKSGQSPLMHAVETNNVNMVHFLIENGCDVNTQSYSGNTALHSACGRGQVDTVRLLLKSGADSSIKNYHNDTPVMVAKNKKITDVLRGRGQRQIRDPHFVSVSPHGTNFTENDSSSPSHSRDCSPSTIQHIGLPHYCASRSPTPSSGLVFPFC